MTDDDIQDFFLAARPWSAREFAIFTAAARELRAEAIRRMRILEGDAWYSYSLEYEDDGTATFVQRPDGRIAWAIGLREYSFGPRETPLIMETFYRGGGEEEGERIPVHRRLIDPEGVVVADGPVIEPGLN